MSDGPEMVMGCSRDDHDESIKTKRLMYSKSVIFKTFLKSSTIYYVLGHEDVSNTKDLQTKNV